MAAASRQRRRWPPDRGRVRGLALFAGALRDFAGAFPEDLSAAFAGARALAAEAGFAGFAVLGLAGPFALPAAAALAVGRPADLLALAAGRRALFVALGFLPKISGLFSVMPAPVMGAILIFVTSFMIVSGVQIILGSGMDARKTFVVGIALIFGLSLDLVPGLYGGVPAWLRPLFDSSLTLTTVIASTEPVAPRMAKSMTVWADCAPPSGFLVTS